MRGGILRVVGMILGKARDQLVILKRKFGIPGGYSIVLGGD